jgi:hypothetical protein
MGARNRSCADRDMTCAMGGAIDDNQMQLGLSSSCPEGKAKPMSRGELRREEWLLFGTMVCVDRVGAFDKLSEGNFCMPLPPNSGKIEVVH